MADVNVKITADNRSALASIEQVNRALQGVSSSSDAVNRGMGALTNTMRALGAAVVGASLFNFVDDLQNMQNKLRIAAKSSEEFAASMEYIRAIADKTGTSLTATGDLYSAVARNAEKLGYNQAQVATVTNAMATALKASGASAQGSASVMYQFSQILAKGKVNGDEFTTVMENLGGPVMDLIAKNMGVTTAELVKLKEKGLIGAKDFTDALIRSMGELDQMSGRAIPTLSQNLTRVQNAFGDFVIKLDRATGFTQTLGDAMVWLSKNVNKVLPLMAALAGYFIAGRILTFAVAMYEAVKAIRAVGVAASVTSALMSGGVAALTGLAGAAVAYAATTKLFDDMEESIGAVNVNLEETGKIAESSLGTTNSQLSGITDKYQQILQDLDRQLSLTASSNREYNIESQLLNYNKDLQYKMTEEQRRALSTRLQQLEALKAERNINDDLRKIQSDIKGYSSVNRVTQEEIRAIESIRLQYGDAIAEKYGRQVAEATKALMLAQRANQIESERRNLTSQYWEYLSGINKLSAAELDINLKLLSVENELGIKLSEEEKSAIRVTEQRRAQLGFLQQMKQNIQALNTPLGGEAAGAAASGQLGSLLPVEKIQTDQQTLMNGLKYLRDQDLISVQQYEQAKVQAAISANEAIYNAEKTMFQNKALLRIQETTGTQFGYETQKQMAQEAANFEKKSTLEKTQFAMDQAASVFNSLGAHNKKAFEAAKAFNIANAVMNTYMGATKALATYPPPFNFIAAAAVVAAGLAQVASIRSQQYSGRQLGGPVMGGTPYIVGENGPELFTPNTTGSITRNGDLGGGGTTNVNFTIVANDTTDFDQLLTSRRGLITQIISDAQLEKGRRA